MVTGTKLLSCRQALRSGTSLVTCYVNCTYFLNFMKYKKWRKHNMINDHEFIVCLNFQDTPTETITLDEDEDTFDDDDDIEMVYQSNENNHSNDISNVPQSLSQDYYEENDDQQHAYEDTIETYEYQDALESSHEYSLASSEFDAVNSSYTDAVTYSGHNQVNSADSWDQSALFPDSGTINQTTEQVRNFF